MGCGANSKPHAPDYLHTPSAAPAAQSNQDVVHTSAKPPPPPPPTATAEPSPAPSGGATEPAPTDEWDEWDDEDDGPTRSAPPPTSGPTLQPSEHAAFRAATDGVLCIGGHGGPSMEVGLRCTSCGQRVHRFAQHRWNESADYYTFRNFSPDERMPERQQEDLAKLAAWLQPDADAAAYACGCTWQTVREGKPIEAEGGVPAAPHGGARLGEASPLLKWTLTPS